MRRHPIYTRGDSTVNYPTRRQIGKVRDDYKLRYLLNGATKNMLLRYQEWGGVENNTPHKSLKPDPNVGKN